MDRSRRLDSCDRFEVCDGKPRKKTRKRESCRLGFNGIEVFQGSFMEKKASMK